MSLSNEDKQWFRETIRHEIKEEIDQLRIDLIGEDGRMMVEIKRHIRDRMAVYHPTESA